MSDRVVIIGASHAGVAVIETLRNKGFKGRLTLITEEKLPLYSPTTLPYLLDRKDRGLLVLRPQDFFRGIEVIEGRASEIDERKGSVTLENGREVRYGKLVVATGASPVVPFPAAPGASLFTVRKLKDVTQLARRLKRGTTVLLVGGGLIGLHLAQVFLDRGQKLHLVELGDQLLPGLIHREPAEEIERRFVEKGATVSLATSVESLEERAALLSDGEKIAFDFAVVAAGVRPNVECLKRTAVETGRGIRVNQWMETNVPAILGCGDVAEGHDFFTGVPRLSPNIMNAVEQGRAVAGRLMGEEEPHPGVIACMTCRYMDMNLFSVGMAVPGPDDRVLDHVDRAEGVYRRLIVRDGVLKGAVFCNTPADHGLFYRILKQKVPIDGLEEKILKEPFQWAKVVAQ